MAKKLTNMNTGGVKNLLTAKSASIKDVVLRDPNHAPAELVGVQKSIKKGRKVVSDSDDLVEEQLAQEEAEAAEASQESQEALV
jgi:hypothetical protein